MSRPPTIILAALLCLTNAPGQASQRAQRNPASSARSVELRTSGSALRQKGCYDEAIAEFTKALRDSPDDVDTLYELGLTYLAKGDLGRSLQIGNEGLLYRSDHLSGFYVLVAKSLLRMGQNDSAIKFLKGGIARFPDNSNVYHQLGVAYLALNRPLDARRNFERAAIAEPNNAALHLDLSGLYIKEHRKIPVLFAALRFLMLQPRSDRSPEAIRLVNQILTSGVPTVLKPGRIKFDDLIVREDNDEGDFNRYDSVLDEIGRRYANRGRSSSELDLFADNLTLLFARISADSRKSSGFAWDYYRPFFCTLSDKRLVGVLAVFVHQSVNAKEARNWLTQHSEEVQKLKAATQEYQWPKP